MSPRRNWDSPNPSLASECASPLQNRGGGAHSPAGEGLGESYFRRLEKKPNTLPTLWVDPMFLVYVTYVGKSFFDDCPLQFVYSMEYLFDDTVSLFFAIFFAGNSKSYFKSLHILIESPIESSLKNRMIFRAMSFCTCKCVHISYVGNSIHGKLNLFAFLLVNK
jgi:hypothetical protein